MLPRLLEPRESWLGFEGTSQGEEGFSGSVYQKVPGSSFANKMHVRSHKPREFFQCEHLTHILGLDHQTHHRDQQQLEQENRRYDDAPQPRIADQRATAVSDLVLVLHLAENASTVPARPHHLKT